MSHTASRRYTDRMKALIRRESHPTSVLEDYKGGNPSYTIAERAAIRWAIDVIEANPVSALTLIKGEE